MTNLRQAAQQALEALKDERYVTKYTHIVAAITALHKALEQPEQEPVAFVNADHLQGLTLGHYGYAEIYTDESEGRVPVYTAPLAAQRPWQGLTDEDRRKFAAAQYGWEDLLIAAEAKLKDRNGN